MKSAPPKDLRRLFQITTWVALFFIALMLALPLWKLWPLILANQTIPLHYNTYFGVDVLGPWYRVFYPAILGTIFLGANRLFAHQLLVRERLLAMCLMMGIVLIEIVLFAGVVFTVLVNL